MDYRKYLDRAKRLADITKLAVNNDDCVVLKIKNGKEFDLIALGVFRGSETMFRLTKGKDVICTVFRENGTHFSWGWGESGFTLVSKETETMGDIIQTCIEHVYGIKCRY